MKNKIVFMGTPIFSVPILKSLYQNGYPVSVVYTQPPNKSQRGQKLKNSPIHNISEILNLEVRTPLNLKNNENEYNFLKNLKADLAIVVAYGQIIPKDYLALTKKGFINIHGSLLPLWRGAAPIQRSIMNLDNETGISIMKIEEELDSGPVSNFYKIKLDRNQNAQEISEKLSILAAEKILDNIDDILEDKAKFIEQDHSKATYAKKIDKKDSEIKWNMPAKNLIAIINGLNPFPGVWFKHKNNRIKIFEAIEVDQAGKTGEVLDKKLTVACGDKAIRILSLQKEGKKILKTEDFLAGYKITEGEILI